jgi:hypothetical protein
MPLSLTRSFTQVYPILYPPVCTPQEETKPNANLVVWSWVQVRYTSSVAVLLLLMCYKKMPLSLTRSFTQVFPILYPPVCTPQEETKPNANLVVWSWVQVRYTSSVAVLFLPMCFTKDAIISSRKLYPSLSYFVPTHFYPLRGNQTQCQPCSEIMGPGQVYQLSCCIFLTNVLYKRCHCP